MGPGAVGDMRWGMVFKSGEETENEIQIARKVGLIRPVAAMAQEGGKWLVILAVLAGIYLYWPMLAAESKYAFWQTPWSRKIDLAPKIVSKGEIEEQAKKPGWLVPDQRFSVYIPKINAISRVIPNVNPFDRTEYLPGLKKGVAHARGLGVPGQMGTTYLFAHSVASRADYARYNAVFYLLHKLEAGDGIELVYEGNWYKYQVTETKVLGAKDVSFLKPQTDREILVLQTCYPPGTTWKRLIVVAKLVNW